MLFERCKDAIPAVKNLRGQPRKRPRKLHADIHRSALVNAPAVALNQAKFRLFALSRYCEVQQQCR